MENFEILLQDIFKILTEDHYLRSSRNLVTKYLQDLMERSSKDINSRSSFNLVAIYIQAVTGTQKKLVFGFGLGSEKTHGFFQENRPIDEIVR